MSQRVSRTPTTTRPSPTRRRHRPACAAGTARHTPDLVPYQRDPAEAEPSSARPTLTWVLLPDSTGRLRPQARWI
ncbi:hypothetical protein AC529_02600 [Thermobifida cellulosilytica TB100]|uniref:Uncharacterized protein n=1 Tax=Thermobifida cellulosilytica TB100 TaxID=665004 RepID=A0A147KLS0_THECS|nr:hypothetical protein AC529_02600 [Thermobifida cellulosilytica TB100]